MMLLYVIMIFLEVLGAILLVIGIVALIRGKLALVSGLRAEGAAARVAAAVLVLMLPLSMGLRILVQASEQPHGIFDREARAQSQLVGGMVEIAISVSCLLAAGAIAFAGGPQSKYGSRNRLATGNPFASPETDEPLDVVAAAPPTSPPPAAYVAGEPKAGSGSMLPLLLVGMALTVLFVCGLVGALVMSSGSRVTPVAFSTIRASQITQRDNQDPSAEHRWPAPAPDLPQPTQPLGQKPTPIQPVMLSGPGISTDWQIVFRSHDPSIWDKDVNDSEQHYARAHTQVPGDIRYLRLRKSKEFVIIEMTKQRLRQTSINADYGWTGMNEFNWKAHHLGIFDKTKEYFGIGGSVCLQVNPFLSGWGFGHVRHEGTHQGYCWNGIRIPSTVFEIAVKPGDLTNEETKTLLKKAQ